MMKYKELSLHKLDSRNLASNRFETINDNNIINRNNNILTPNDIYESDNPTRLIRQHYDNIVEKM